MKNRARLRGNRGRHLGMPLAIYAGALPDLAQRATVPASSTPVRNSVGQHVAASAGPEDDAVTLV